MELDMVQYDCPYIDTTADADVSFTVRHWDFDAAAETLETRILMAGESPRALDEGLDRLDEHEKMQGFELLRRKGTKLLLRSTISETKAMESIRTNDGYITGPFEIREGSEIWRVGFDSRRAADDALADLDRHNDFTVESREPIDLEGYHEVVQNIDTALGLLEVCNQLSTVERETLQAAVDEGYFSRPREATLGTLADAFDVSKAAVSKNLRRSQRKILGPVVDTFERLDGTATEEGQ